MATVVEAVPAVAGDELAVRPRTTRRRVVGIAALLLVLLAVTAASLLLGARSLSPGVVWAALVDPVTGNADHDVVRTLRIPRTLVGLVGGIALGLAGALMQGVTRNPIADPGLLGVNSGASLFVVTAISVFGVSTVEGYLWFAFAGAGIASLLVYGVSSLGWDGVTPVKLALVGAAFTAVATSLITLVLLTDQHTLDEYRFWQVGSLVNRPLSVLTWTAPAVAVGAVLALASSRTLNVMALGDDVARGLGQDLRRGRLVIIGSVILLCGAATSMVGPIAFVGLMVPHVARFVAGPDHRWILPLSGLLGPVLLLTADIIGRLIALPGEMEAGLVVAFIGAPVLIVLVRRSRNVAA
ncbi:FecCD family ABC transporter permease [Nakamurella deserti]|uniref:FecCD family ABC transporter permease n=1 Tax=Nakamurella deserti TaxID=2164074 RepID=UPI001F0B7471|nr:iron chelate uptake ABC transporter family permease subunit [Nakamurella deserti]